MTRHLIEERFQRERISAEEARQAREAANEDLLHTKCILSRLLPELRLDIYDLVLEPNQTIVISKQNEPCYNRSIVTVRAESGGNSSEFFVHKYALTQTCRFFRKETLNMIYGKNNFKFYNLEVATRFFKTRPLQAFEQLVQKQFILQRTCCGGPNWGHLAHHKDYRFDLKNMTVVTLGEIAPEDKKYTECIACTKETVPKFQAELEEGGVVARNKGKRRLLAMVKMVFKSQFGQGKLVEEDSEEAEDESSEKISEEVEEAEDGGGSGEASEDPVPMVRYYLRSQAKSGVL